MTILLDAYTYPDEIPTVRKIVCVGAGYVGAPTSAIIALKCPEIQVVVVDISESRIAAFNSAQLPIFEPGLHEVVMSTRGRNLLFSTDLQTHIADADIIFVSVNTPTKMRGIGAGAASDLSNWEAAGRSIAQFSEGPKVIVEKSTVPVRTAAALQKVLNYNRRDGCTFEVLSNPEFLAEGTAIQDLLDPGRILIGGNYLTPSGRQAIAMLRSVYERWVPSERILTADVWSSELAKLTANAFLAQRISSINSIAQLCERTGADVTQVARAVGMDDRIGSKFLRASVGFGGSCFQKDILNLVYICESKGLHEVGDYWLQVVKMNDWHKEHFVHRMLQAMFNTVRGKKIAVFGFAFKKDTADVRETPALTVCNKLLIEGARVCVYDPMVKLPAALWEANQHGIDLAGFGDNFAFSDEPTDAVNGADAIAVLTDWDEFKDCDYTQFFAVMRRPAYIFDGSLSLDHEHLARLGFEVRCIGKSPLVPGVERARKAKASDCIDEEFQFNSNVFESSNPPSSAISSTQVTIV